ncbi:latent transforming growth factor beta binding protein like (3F865) [Cryptosporidium felis]|nr:latent transforming growth factor beta binding protein like (3F865) [Cryptosporidium felis]
MLRGSNIRNFTLIITLLANLIYILASEPLSNSTWVSPQAQNYNGEQHELLSDEGTSDIKRRVVEAQNRRHRHHHHKSQQKYQYYNTNTYIPKYTDSTDDERSFVNDQEVYEADRNHYYHYDRHHKNVYQMDWNHHKYDYILNLTTTTTTLPVFTTTSTITMNTSTTSTTTMNTTTTSTIAISTTSTTSNTTSTTNSTTSTTENITTTTSTTSKATTTTTKNTTITSTTKTTTTTATTNNTTTTSTENTTTTSTTSKATTTSTTSKATTTSTTSKATTTSTTSKATTTSTTSKATTTSTTSKVTTTSTTESTILTSTMDVNMGSVTTTSPITTTKTETTTSTISINTTTSTTSTTEPSKYAVSLVMDLSKVPNVDQMKEINLSANIIYRNLIESGVNAEILSVPINEPSEIEEHTSFISRVQGINNVKVDRLLNIVAQQNSDRFLKVVAQNNETNSQISSNQRGYKNKLLFKRRKIVYITTGFNGCTSEKTCPGIVKLKKDIDIYVISLSKDPKMYHELEYISTEPVSLHSIMINKYELNSEATHISKWIKDEYRFNNPKFLVPKKLKKGFKNEVCSRCSENADCFVHSVFEQTRDLNKFECVCSGGWTGDGITCHDIDECKTIEKPCGNSHCCINKPGGFECKYSSDGKCLNKK